MLVSNRILLEHVVSVKLSVQLVLVVLPVQRRLCRVQLALSDSDTRAQIVN